MGQRGRRSAASLAVVSPITDARPAPPDDLTADQAAEWDAVTRRLPSGYFPRETHALLATYCRHVVVCRRLSKLMDEFQGDWFEVEGGLERLDRLGKMRDREGRAMSSAATRLRMTPASSELEAIFACGIDWRLSASASVSRPRCS